MIRKRAPAGLMLIPATLFVLGVEGPCSRPSDGDRDGVPDGIDNCPGEVNPNQSDVDDDGWGDACDNCPDIYNPDQADADHDGSGDVCDDSLDDVVMRFMFNPQPQHLFDAPQVYEFLNEIVAEFEQVYGVQVELVQGLPADRYEDGLLWSLEEENPPDLLWVPYELAPVLIERGYVVPVTDWIGWDSELIWDTPEWMLDSLTYDGELYGIPAEDDGEGLYHAYMVTAAGADRQLVAQACQLMTEFKSDANDHPHPNLVIDTLTLDVGEVVSRAGAEVQISAVVSNIGHAAAEGIEVTFRLDRSGELLEESIDYLGPDETALLELATVAQEGQHRLTASVDPLDLIQERDESDNDTIEPFDVYPFGAPPSVPPEVKATSDPFVIDQRAYRHNVRGMGPKVAFDGANYLVVWAKENPLYHPSYSHQLRGMRISPYGTILDHGGFLIASRTSKYNTFRIAFDGTNYLVVWDEEPEYRDPSDNPSHLEGYIIEGTRVSPNGTVLDTASISIDLEPVSPGLNYRQHRSPNVFYDGSNFVVTYRESDMISIIWDTRIVAKRVSSAGVVLPGKTTLFDLPKVRWLTLPRVAWSQGQGLLAAWCIDDTIQEYAIYSSVLSYNGGPLTAGPLKLIASGAEVPMPSGCYKWPVDAPCVASSAYGEHLVVYEDERNKPVADYVNPDLSAALVHSPVSQPGGIVTDKGQIVHGTSDEYPAVAFDGRNYCVVYRHHHGCHAYVGAVRVSPQGVAGTPTYFNTVYDLVAEVDVAFGSSNGLVVFEDFNPPLVPNGPFISDGIFAQFIEKSL